MGCRGAMNCAHLGSRGIPQDEMNCAPTPCAYLKGIDPCGQPWEVGLKLVPIGDPLRSPWKLGDQRSSRHDGTNGYAWEQVGIACPPGRCLRTECEGISEPDYPVKK